MANKLDTLEPSFKAKIEKLIGMAKEHGITLLPVSCLRTIAEQNKLYAQGRTTKGPIVTKAKGGQSAHNFALACDLCPVDAKGKLWWNAPDDVWQVVAILSKGLGLVPGYYFRSIKDSPHHETKDWKVQQELWKSGKIVVK